MPTGNEAVKRVLQAFDEADWAEIHLSYGDVEIHLSTDGGPTQSAATSHVSAKSTGETAPDGTAVPAREEEPRRAQDADEQSPGQASPGDDEPAGSVAVPAPTPGIFWRAPSPGAPPFTEVGARVSQGDALCIVEVMKLMSTLTAPVDGLVVRIGAENGEQVDQRRTLFHILPDTR